MGGKNDDVGANLAREFHYHRKRGNADEKERTKPIVHIHSPPGVKRRRARTRRAIARGHGARIAVPRIGMRPAPYAAVIAQGRGRCWGAAKGRRGRSTEGEGMIQKLFTTHAFPPLLLGRAPGQEGHAVVLVLVFVDAAGVARRTAGRRTIGGGRCRGRGRAGRGPGEKRRSRPGRDGDAEATILRGVGRRRRRRRVRRSVRRSHRGDDGGGAGGVRRRRRRRRDAFPYPPRRGHHPRDHFHPQREPLLRLSLSRIGGMVVGVVLPPEERPREEVVRVKPMHHRRDGRRGRLRGRRLGNVGEGGRPLAMVGGGRGAGGGGADDPVIAIVVRGGGHRHRRRGRNRRSRRRPAMRVRGRRGRRG
jgi:hypothetical protein